MFVMNHGMTRCKVNGYNDPATIERIKQLQQWQTDTEIRKLYERYKDNPQIKWKDSIKKVVGIDSPVDKGLDI